MGFPIKTCVKCGEEFELRPGKPGFANRCLECTEEEMQAGADGGLAGGATGREAAELNEARRTAMRELLYRKDS